MKFQAALVLLFTSISIPLLGWPEDDAITPRNRRVVSGVTGRELQKQAKERSRDRKVREKRMANAAIELIFDGSAAEIKPLILQRMSDRKAKFISSSEFRLSFWEPVTTRSRDWRTWATAGYYAGGSRPYSETMHPQMRIDFILLPLGAETDVRVLCGLDETPERDSQAISSQRGTCGRKTLGLRELLQSVRVEPGNRKPE